jgi:hypothetical protein
MTEQDWHFQLKLKLEHETAVLSTVLTLCPNFRSLGR